MQTQELKYLKFINFKELSLWDVKRLFLSDINSKYEIVELSEVIKERSEKVALYDFPKEKFWILWVNNKVWLFDAYEELWENINQKYKKVYLWDIAYNPYRVNVGSVWLKTEKQKYNYISPAYVVFSCDNNKLNYEYFYILFKTDFFNKIINENTTGSVRQNFKFSTLSKIKIPLPPLEIQEKLVKEYYEKIELAEQKEKEAEILEKQIEDYLIEELGIEVEKREEKKKGLQFVEFKDLEKWGVDKIFISLKDINKSIFKIYKIEDLCYIKKWQSLSRKNLIEWNIPVIAGWRVSPYYHGNYNFVWENITISSSWAHAWYVWYHNYPIFVSDAMVIYSKNKKVITNKFLFEFLKFRQNFIYSLQQWAAQPHVYSKDIKNLQVPLPPLETQEKIVNYIWELKEKIKNLKTEAEELKKKARSDFEMEVFS